MQPKTHELDAILVSECDLKTAFNRTGLKRIGYSFEQAIACSLIKRCLLRIVLNTQKQAVKVVVTSSKKAVIPTKPQRELWFKKYY